MKFGIVLAALAGLLGAAYLIFYVGFDAVLHAALSVGWGGFALLCLFGLGNFALLGMAWFLIVPPYRWHSAMTFAWSRAVRDSAGDVLPFSQLGGMVIGARAAILRGVGKSCAFASMVVDVTMEMLAQIVVIVAGLIILTLHLPGDVVRSPLVETTIVGILLGVLAAVAFVVVQRKGFAFFEHIAERFLPAAAAHAGTLDKAINRIHAEPLRMVGGFCVHVLGWLAGAFGTWLALTLIGSPLSFLDAIAIESLIGAARSAAVFVPAAIGIQEAGYAVLVPLFGLPADIGVAVSLLKRAQQLAVGAPILLGWQLAEGGHALAVKNGELLLDRE
ncbi:MAG: flippase-like domain-containing protein [Alphaproteobacteria bacterium]|nr:flippase-like domain-containing protein [Alphaproteobacteria bacterium]MDE2350451.1 flippase-like domain-containing protein [Alphaproteobacteria bacterium]